MTKFPKRMNLHKIVFSKLVNVNVPIDNDFKEPTTDKYYGDPIDIKGQYVYLYEANKPIRRSFSGNEKETKGRVVVSRDELIKKNLLEYDKKEKIDTLHLNIYDKIIQLGINKVNFIINSINDSGQLMSAGSVPVIYVFYFTEDTEVIKTV